MNALCVCEKSHFPPVAHEHEEEIARGVTSCPASLRNLDNRVRAALDQSGRPSFLPPSDKLAHQVMSARAHGLERAPSGPTLAPPPCVRASLHAGLACFIGVSLHRLLPSRIYLNRASRTPSGCPPLQHVQEGEPLLSRTPVLIYLNLSRLSSVLEGRWWALPLNVSLPLSNGDSCQLLYAGRPGGSLGPDVRDAVLRFTSHRATTTFADLRSQDARNAFGDVEIHIRASDWFAHQHHTDARYNNVMLHVVLICDDSRPALRQDGTAIPTFSLYDLPPTTNHPAQWPCQHVMARLNEEQRACLLTLAGIRRFEQKADTLREALRGAQPSELFSACDVCLIPALAEGLGYGRDRAFFRAAGLRLIGVAQSIPEPLGRAPEPSPLDASRLHILHNLIEQWRTTGAWNPFRQVLLSSSPNNAHHLVPCRGGGGVEMCGDACVAHTYTSSTPTAIFDLRNIFEGLSKARADILFCNIVLPFAAAVALQENDALLAEQARNLFTTYPGLPSNQITRAMCKQLLLRREPKGACQQQGLHFIYAQTCREKRCIDCLLGKQDT